jgi:hypothetical protein
MPTPWKKNICGSQNNHSILQQYIFASTIETSPKNAKAYCLAIVTILMASSLRLLDIIYIWKILQNIKSLLQNVGVVH